MLRESALAFSLLFLLIGPLAAQAQQQDPEAQPTTIEVESLQSLSAQLPADPQAQKRREMKWDLEFAGEFEGEGQDEALAVMTSLGLEMDFRFTQSLLLKLSPGAKFYSARAQKRFDSDNFEDRVTLREAYLQYSPSPLFTAGVGTYSQNFISQPQLISGGRSFPALYLASEHSFEMVKVYAQAEEAVPTSYTYNALREEKEALPGLRALKLGTDIKLTSDLEANFAVGNLNWRNLPSRVAFTSQQLGNTPSGENFEASSRFRTGFDIQFAEVGLLACRDCRWSFEVSFRRSRNSQAPSDSADAQMFGGGIRHHGKDLNTTFLIHDFFAESDVTPASYSQSSLGNTNRKGLMAQLEVEIPSLDIKMKGQWIQANPLAASPYQNDRNSIYLGVETDGNFL